MASMTLSKSKLLFKLGKIFKLREAPANPQPKAKHVSAPEPDSKAPTTTTSLAKNPTLVANIVEPAAVMPKTPELSKVSLWGRAYDGLRERDKELVEEYEKLLSRELQTSTSLKNGINDSDEIHVTAENLIENVDHRIRLAQLETIASRGLQQLDEKKAKFNIFGHEFILRDQLAQYTQFIQTIKDTIDVAVKASPEASLAWAGVCVMLPTFMNPSAAEEASRNGYLYTTSRSHFYTKLESLLSTVNRQRTSDLGVELEDRLQTLYQLVIDFQLRVVRRVNLKRLERFKEDTLQHEDWKGMIAKIQEAERMFIHDFKLVSDVDMRITLGELSSNADKLCTAINSKLGSLCENSRNAPTFSIQSGDSGSHFSTTGRTQNNVKGTAIKVLGGMTFTGPVTINMN